MTKNRKRLTKGERAAVYSKMGGKCAYCGQKITLLEMQADHVRPLRKGGADSLDNMLPACRECNHYKSTYDIEQFRAELGKLVGRLDEMLIFRLAVKFGIIAINPAEITFEFERDEI